MYHLVLDSIVSSIVVSGQLWREHNKIVAQEQE